MSNKKILVIITGGTIGSEYFDNTINVSKSADSIVDRYNLKYKSNEQFDVISPIHILSENLTSFEWQTLLKCLYSTDFKKYKGIIITHGSDTLAYTSAFLGFAFATSEIPIVITAADKPLSNPNSNGFDNFNSAVCLINQGMLCGVFTAYKSSDGDNNIYLSTRITPADSYTGDFGCFGGEVFAKIVSHEVVFNINPNNPNISELKKQAVSVPELSLKRRVIKIEPYPDIDYSQYVLNDNISAVLHTLYHSSTAPTTPKSGLIKFIERCKAHNIDFYICPFIVKDEMYKTSQTLIESGAIPLKNISEYAAFSKLYCAYSQDKINPKEFMMQNIFFEYIK